MRILSKLTATILLLTSCIGYSSILDTSDTERYAVIGVVDGSILPLAQQLILTKADTVTILVNSPGGSVDLGNLFIQAMEQVKSRGVTINCVSGALAASMGFQILAHCNNIYALPSTLLLFHPVRIMGKLVLTAQQLDYISSQMKLAEAELVNDLLKKFKFKKEYFDYHFQAETLHAAKELAVHTPAIIIVDDVKGFDELLYTFMRPSMFSLRGLSYIHEQFILDRK